MKIREATTEDIPALVELWKEFMDFHRSRDSYFSRTPDGHERWAKFATGNIDKDDWLFIVAEIDGTIGGYCMATILDNPPVIPTRQYGYIQDIVVTSGNRRSGIGTALFKHAEHWLLSKGMDRIELDVSTTNEVSSAFWRNNGFGDYLERLSKSYPRGASAGKGW
jgi:ribosomal protein S18 acetylase RimI-like enzyme